MHATAIETPPRPLARPLPDVPGVHHRFVDAGRLTFHVAEAGDGEPVVLLHGWPQHWYAWRRLIPLLARDHRLICPDLRGFGWTDAPPGGYGTPDIVDDVVALLDALELDRAHVIGQDWGGHVGVHLCLRAPARVDRFLALAAPHPYLRARGLLRHAWWYTHTVLVETPLLGRVVVRRMPWFTRLLLRMQARDRSVETAEFVAAVREPARARASERMMLHRGYRETIPMLRGRHRSTRLTVPTRLLVGTRDHALSPRACGGHEPYADDLRVQPVDGGAHLLAETHPDAVAAAAREHFE